jgi:hypothetical protein
MFHVLVNKLVGCLEDTVHVVEVPEYRAYTHICSLGYLLGCWSQYTFINQLDHGFNDQVAASLAS